MARASGSKVKARVITRGGGNVFADLGFADAEERQTKLRLAYALNTIMDAQRLTQGAACAEDRRLVAHDDPAGIGLGAEEFFDLLPVVMGVYNDGARTGRQQALHDNVQQGLAVQSEQGFGRMRAIGEKAGSVTGGQDKRDHRTVIPGNMGSSSLQQSQIALNRFPIGAGGLIIFHAFDIAAVEEG